MYGLHALSMYTTGFGNIHYRRLICIYDCYGTDNGAMISVHFLRTDLERLPDQE